jgi:hypothetical protein
MAAAADGELRPIPAHTDVYRAVLSVFARETQRAALHHIHRTLPREILEMVLAFLAIPSCFGQLSIDAFSSGGYTVGHPLRPVFALALAFESPWLGVHSRVSCVFQSCIGKKRVDGPPTQAFTGSLAVTGTPPTLRPFIAGGRAACAILIAPTFSARLSASRFGGPLSHVHHRPTAVGGLGSPIRQNGLCLASCNEHPPTLSCSSPTPLIFEYIGPYTALLELVGQNRSGAEPSSMSHHSNHAESQCGDAQPDNNR